MFNRRTKPLGTTPVKFLTALSTIPNRFATRTLPKNLILPRDSLTTNAFLGLRVFMKVGYFLSRGCSPCLFPEPALSPPLFFFRQPCDDGRTTPLYLLLDNWDSLMVDDTIVGSEILIG